MPDTIRFTAIIEKGDIVGTAISELVKKKKCNMFVNIAVRKYLQTPEGAMMFKDLTGHDLPATGTAGDG